METLPRARRQPGCYLRHGTGYAQACETLGVGQYANSGAYYFDDFARYEGFFPSGTWVYDTHAVNSIRVGADVIIELYDGINYGGSYKKLFDDFPANPGVYGGPIKVALRSDLSGVLINTPPTQALAGNTFDLEYRISNAGPGADPNPQVKIPLPEGVTFTGDSFPACVADAENVVCNLSLIPAGGNIEGYISFQTAVNASPGARLQPGLLRRLRKTAATGQFRLAQCQYHQPGRFGH
jgi:hypothetical protein